LEMWRGSIPSSKPQIFWSNTCSAIISQPETSVITILLNGIYANPRTMLKLVQCWYTEIPVQAWSSDLLQFFSIKNQDWSWTWV
jgi:hypothetical protein